MPQASTWWHAVPSFHGTALVLSKKSYCNAYHKSGHFDAEILVENLFEVLTGHVLIIVRCHGWYLCNQTYKSLFSYNQMSRRKKKIENGNDLIRFISQLCEQWKSINGAERFPQSIWLRFTAVITTLATLGTTWQQCGQDGAQTRPSVMEVSP